MVCGYASAKIVGLKSITLGIFQRKHSLCLLFISATQKISVSYLKRFYETFATFVHTVEISLSFQSLPAVVLRILFLYFSSRIIHINLRS